ncbi:MAG: hypothetical protein ACRCX2_15780 [Paraclostridium sp.]
MAGPKKQLAIEQVRFLENYLRNFDLEEACDRSGITKDIGEETLQHPIVREIVDKEENMRFRRLTVSASKTVLHIAEMAYKEPMLPTDPIEYECRKVALQGITDQTSLKALELLCKFQDTLGMSTAGGSKEEDVIDKVSTVDGAKSLFKRIIGVKD